MSLLASKLRAQSYISRSNQEIASFILNDPLHQDMLDSYQENTAPVVLAPKTIGVNPMGKVKLPVPPTMNVTSTHSSGRTGLHQSIIFTPAGNTRLVTSITIR